MWLSYTPAEPWLNPSDVQPSEGGQTQAMGRQLLSL